MKKFIYLALIGVALMVRPVSGSDSSVYTALAHEHAYGSSDATELIPEKVRVVLDKVRPTPSRASKHPVVHIQRGELTPHHMQLAAITPDYYAAPRPHREPSPLVESVPPSEPGDWTLLPAALLLIGFIIRRRTAVR